MTQQTPGSTSSPACARSPLIFSGSHKGWREGGEENRGYGFFSWLVLVFFFFFFLGYIQRASNAQLDYTKYCLLRNPTLSPPNPFLVSLVPSFFDAQHLSFALVFSHSRLVRALASTFQRYAGS